MTVREQIKQRVVDVVAAFVIMLAGLGVYQIYSYAQWHRQLEVQILKENERQLKAREAAEKAKTEAEVVPKP